MLTIEQLLRPRYKIIADYPGNPYEIGRIISFDRQRMIIMETESCVLLAPVEGFDSYPHLFELAHWSEGRTKEEFPEYVAFAPKFKAEEIYKVEQLHTTEKGFVQSILCEGEIVPYSPGIYHRPATQEEYEAYKKR
jgi:hypothetical protein